MEPGKQIIFAKQSLPPIEENASLGKYDVLRKLGEEIEAVKRFYDKVDCIKRMLVDYSIPIPDDLTKRVYDSEKRNWKFFKLNE